jgi:hypothetical protein
MSDISANSPRLPGESDRQYFAYCCWEDLQPPRLIEAAYAVYRAGVGIKSRKPSGDWGKWRKWHKWDERALARDAAEKQIFQDAVISLDTEKFFKTLEDHRQVLSMVSECWKTSAALSSQHNVRKALVIHQKYIDTKGKIVSLISENDRQMLVNINRDNFEISRSFKESREVFNEAHHLDGVADALKDRMEKK